MDLDNLLEMAFMHIRDSVSVSLPICIFLIAIFIVTRKSVRISLSTLRRDIDFIIRGILFVWKFRKWQRENTTVHDLFDKMADKFPDKVCFYFEDHKWTYKQVQKLSNRVGHYFQHKGYVKGDIVGLLMGNYPEYVAIWIGLAKIGVVTALINDNLRGKSLKYSLESVHCRGLIYGVDAANAVAELQLTIPIYEYNPHPVADSIHRMPTTRPQVETRIGFADCLLYIYTSGTTGFPKAAIVKHGRFLSMALGANLAQWLTTSDVFYTALPLYHSSGGIVGVGSILFGIPVVIRKKFSATCFWTDCIKYNVTATQYIGEICRYLLAQPPKQTDNQHKIRRMFGNGLRPDVWEEFTKRFNVRALETYGSTEGNCYLTNLDGKAAAVGFIPSFLHRHFPIYLIKVDQITGQVIRDTKTGLLVRCKANEPGELIGIISDATPYRNFEGYSDSSSIASKVIENALSYGDKAFRSGDILVKDEYGYFYFKDRIGDTFRWKGENVSTTEVESVVNGWIINQGQVGLTTPCICYGVQIPGTEGRAGMLALCDPDRKLDLKSLASELRGQLPVYARPLFVRIVNEIGTTGTFKLKKFDLQKQGFGICGDTVYFCRNNSSEFVLLEQEMYANVVNGDIKI